MKRKRMYLIRNKGKRSYIHIEDDGAPLTLYIKNEQIIKTTNKSVANQFRKVNTFSVVDRGAIDGEKETNLSLLAVDPEKVGKIKNKNKVKSHEEDKKKNHVPFHLRNKVPEAVKETVEPEVQPEENNAVQAEVEAQIEEIKVEPIIEEKKLPEHGI